MKGCLHDLLIANRHGTALDELEHDCFWLPKDCWSLPQSLAELRRALETLRGAGLAREVREGEWVGVERRKVSEQRELFA